MEERQRTTFIDGLRITPLHLEHLQSTLQDAIRDLRTVVGLGQIGWGLRLMPSGDTAVEVTAGMGFTRGGERVVLNDPVVLQVPSGGGPWQIVVSVVVVEDPVTKFADRATITSTTSSIVLVEGGDTQAEDALTIGTVAVGDGGVVLSQDAALFTAPARHGHTGEFFLDSMQRWRFDGPRLAEGAEGDPGPPGPVGPPGALGPPGPNGAIGPPGPQGLPGSAGAVGSVGPIGPQGEPGPLGERGPRGVEGAPGTTGSVGPTGLVGPAGVTGERGAPGQRGPSGPPGPLGPLGSVGPAGATGPPGPRGDSGDPGDSGDQGPAGERGEIGPQGRVGPQGPVGEPGTPGERGATGVRGPRGELGSTGPVGAVGSSGKQGERGLVGPVGPSGKQGERGLVGSAGPAGATGKEGPRGVPGEQGPAGDSILDQVTRLADVSWDPNTAQQTDQALETLTAVTFGFSDVIRRAPGLKLELPLVWVTMSANAAASAQVSIRGTPKIDGSSLHWTIFDADLEVLAGFLAKQSAFIWFEVACDLLADGNGLAPSGSTAPLFGVDGPVAPGGTARLLLATLNRRVPQRFGIRPFAATSATPVAVGSDLVAGIVDGDRSAG